MGRGQGAETTTPQRQKTFRRVKGKEVQSVSYGQPSGGRDEVTVRFTDGTVMRFEANSGATMDVYIDDEHAAGPYYS